MSSALQNLLAVARQTAFHFCVALHRGQQDCSQAEGDSSSGALSQLNFSSDQLQIPGCSPEM